MSRRAQAFLVVLAFILSGCAIPVTAYPPHSGARHTARAPRPAAPHLVRIRKDRYRVARPWTVELNGRRWRVQKGYVCNGITAPRHIRKFLGEGVDAPETWAAVFHDWLFTQPGMTRASADRLFHDLLIAYGVPPIKARLMYSGVAAYSASKTLD